MMYRQTYISIDPKILTIGFINITHVTYLIFTKP